MQNMLIRIHFFLNINLLVCSLC